jgi:hypothetical protein
MNPRLIFYRRPLNGGSVERLNAQYFYSLATALVPLRQLKANVSISDQFSLLWTAERFLRAYLLNELTRPGASAASGWELVNALDALTSVPAREEPVSFFEVANISTALLTKFENNLEAEYFSKDVFIVSKKGLLSTTDLIENAEELFSKPIRERITPAIFDIKQAGKCIAFQVSTAAAFHIFRAVEAVARLYVEVVRGTPPDDKEKRLGLGGFVKILNLNGADERVTNAISQLAKLHRNPTMHPDIRIDNDEVIATLGMAQSVIQSMVADMETRQSKPMAEIVDVLPTLKQLQIEAEADSDDEERVRELQLGNGSDLKG